jgi:hypothetical protein
VRSTSGEGVTVTSGPATVDLPVAVAGPDFGYAVEIHGHLELVGLGGITVAGDHTPRLDTIGGEVTQSIAVAGGPDVTVTFLSSEGGSLATPFADVQDDNLTLGLAGRTLTGTLHFIEGAGSFTGTAEHRSASLSAPSSSTPFLTLTEGHGSLTVSSSGVAGSLGGQVALTLPGVALTAGDLLVTVNRAAASPVRSSSTDFTLTVAGQPTR